MRWLLTNYFKVDAEDSEAALAIARQIQDLVEDQMPEVAADTIDAEPDPDEDEDGDD